MKSSNQPTQLEQVVVSTIQGLRQLEDMLGYEFEETIYTIEKLHDIQVKATEREEALGAKDSMTELAGLTYEQASRGF